MNEEFVLATADTPDSQAEAQKTEQPVEQNIDAPEATAAPEMAPVEEATSPEVKTEEVVAEAAATEDAASEAPAPAAEAPDEEAVAEPVAEAG